MKWLMIILTVLMMGCFEDESVTECGTDQIFNETVGVCVLNQCKTGVPNCHEGCIKVDGAGVGGEELYPGIACIYVTGDSFKAE